MNTVTHKDNEMKIRLTLPWKHQTFIHYTVLSLWPPSSLPDYNKCRVEVTLEGPYEILYDIICQKEKQFSSIYRTAVVKKFYNTIQHLQQTDILLVHLHSFTSNSAHYNIPDPLRIGLPMFVIQPGSTAPVPYSEDLSHPIFTTFWKPVCSLDINIWHRWMHTHRIGFLLQHDHPLPKYLLTTNTNGRYYPVQCRKAQIKVYEVIKTWADFCLLENHSYVKFILGENDNHPTSFYVIRVTSKPPCVVVWLAFLAGIPGLLRYQICRELEGKLKELTITQKVCWKDLPMDRIKQFESSSSESEEEEENSGAASKPVTSSQFSEVFACVPLSKPVEKILIRYEKMPDDFCSVLGFFPNRSESPMPGLRGNESLQRHKNRNANAAFLTLSRYVTHQRWIWSIQSCPNTSLSGQAISRILNTLCKLRIHEGFTFAHSSNGIQNMVLEVDMEQEEVVSGSSPTCVLQYIIFPPHTTSSAMESESVSDEDQETNSDTATAPTEADGEIQIITEIWTEPQDGRVVTNQQSELSFLSSLHQKDIASKFFPRDLECVSTLITFEHLCLMCQNPCVASPPGSSLQTDSPHFSNSLQPPPNNITKDSSGMTPRVMPLSSNNNIKHIPFAFDLITLLPKSHQTELLFSMLIQDLSPSLSNYYDWYPSQDLVTDKPNEMLFDQLLAEFERINDREVDLSQRDHKLIPEIIRSRQSSNFRFPSVSQKSPSCHPQPSVSSTNTNFHPPPARGHGLSFSRRNHSGASVTSSSNDTRDSFNLGLDHQELFSSDPKWKCFVKAVSPTHLVLTIIPASFRDLKSLILSEESVAETDSNYVNIINASMSSVTSEDDLEKLGLASMSRLDQCHQQQDEGRNSFSDVLTNSNRRQRSGSDVFEMTRPKIKSARKHSGTNILQLHFV